MIDAGARRAALHVSIAALLLAAAKAAAGIASGSVAVLSSALDSAADALASFANYLFLRLASKPPDADHQFGHGKAEHLAALLQGVILFWGAVMLCVRAAERIRNPEPIESSGAAIVTMIASIFVTVGITVYLRRNAARSGSAALSGDALHYTSDIAANLATIGALILVRATGNVLFDAIFGVMVAGWIAWNSVYLIWNAANDLMDVSIPEDEIAAVVEAIERADPAVAGYRELRTRRAAGVRFIEFELLIQRDISFERAHDVTENVKAAIRARFERSVVTVHAEPV
ncbi:MAG TPA: cation diffusion facilitator family transporter [Thermoanaerobaculia bacterium]|nr:cation diffusion facilitator family transporter [Thermoanaerobaculia bacterium]